jgi:hypothetical protein
MKTLIFKHALIYVLFVIFFAGSVIVHAESEKRKSINKTYKVSGSTVMKLSNSFGKMHVETWDKNEVKVNIEIIVRASNDDRAQDLLDKIDISIDDDNPSSSLSFVTSIGNNKSGRNTSFEINYDVSMPKTNSLDLKNSFGDVYLGDMSGDVDVNVQYGNLKAGSLTGDCDVKLSFGSGFSEIDAIKKGDLKVSYSKLGVEEIGDLDVNSSFSTFENEKAGSMDLIAKYGEVEIEEIDVLEADINFSGFDLGKINKSLVLDIDYGGSLDIGVSKSVKLLDIKSSFGPVNINLEPGINASVEANMSFCNLKYDEDVIEFSKIIKDHSSSQYEGKIGNGSGTIVKIISKYGNVRID